MAIACGLNTRFGDIDAYHAAAAGIEEAMQLGVLAHLSTRLPCWTTSAGAAADKPDNLGALVRACEACYDLAMWYGAPFISGKDSLNNEFNHRGETIVIPHTLLITCDRCR